MARSKLSHLVLLASLAVAALVLVACGSGDDGDLAAPGDDDEAAAAEPGPDDGDEAADEEGDGDADPDDSEDADEAAEESEAPDLPDPADVGANELGVVPVLMYHRLLDDGGGDYDLTPEEFQAELERLYEEDYRPVRLKDLVRGEFDVPAGTTPVVLTFDDSTREQAALEDGKIARDTALGMLLEFAEEHPDFEPVASLYVNAYPWGGGEDSDDITRRLHELGFEIGNHTHGHQRLDHLSDAEVQHELAEGKRAITDVIPDAEVVTMALPLGIWGDPRDPVYEGESDGVSYEHEGILLVGSNPAPSPFRADFDPLAIPRIRSAPWDGGEPDYGSGYWLEWLQDNPERRYVSDGDPETISFPADLAEELAPAHEERANPYE